MQYLLTGGTGFIGSELRRDLLAAENSCIILTRNKLSSTKECRYINNLDEIASNEKIDYIINLAGKPIDCIWHRFNKRALLASRVATTNDLVALVQRLVIKPAVMVSASAIGYYGLQPAGVVTENTKPLPAFANELCQQWEQAAQQVEQYNVRLCILRLGVVLGNGGFINKVLPSIKYGLGTVLGDGTQLLSWIHIQDVINGIKFLLANDACHGSYNFVAPTTTTNQELMHAIGKLLNRAVRLKLPPIAIKFLFGQMGRELLLHGSLIQPTKLQQMNYQFSYRTINTALKSILSGVSR